MEYSESAYELLEAEHASRRAPRRRDESAAARAANISRMSPFVCLKLCNIFEKFQCFKGADAGDAHYRRRYSRKYRLSLYCRGDFCLTAAR